MLKILLDKEETVSAVSLSISTINRLVIEGRFPKPVRVGTRVLWRHSELVEWSEKLGDGAMLASGKKRGRPRLAV
jgi:predicted DNA-binding transcriptional regulator AlpA